MRILFVEDDQTLGTSLQHALRQDGHAANLVVNAKEARAATKNEHYDLVIVDLALPLHAGLDLIVELRQQEKLDVPILALGDRLDKSVRVNALDAGADDYLLKPFGLDELRANIRALTRRHAGRYAPLLEHGRLVLDPASRSATLDGQPIEITAREFSLLEILLENAGRVASKSRLEEALYAWDEEVESNAVEVHIHRLRKKLGPDFIRTVRGVGYVIDRLRPPEAGEPSVASVKAAAEVDDKMLEPLLSALDMVFAKLRHDLLNERAICNDLSNSLRRPLNALKLQAELALSATDEKVRAQALYNIVRATDRAQSFLDSVAAVFHLNGRSGLKLEKEVALCEICEGVIAELAQTAFERGLEISLNAPCEGIIHGDAVLLTVMMRQLLEKAIRTVPRNDHIDVTLSHLGEEVFLTVSDNRVAVSEDSREEQISEIGPMSEPVRTEFALIERVAELHAGVLMQSQVSPVGINVELRFPLVIKTAVQQRRSNVARR